MLLRVRDLMQDHMPIRRGSALLAACLLLSSCSENVLPAFATNALAATQLVGIEQVAYAGGDVQLTAPKGYCFDSRWIRKSRNSGFALLARCDVLGISGLFGNRDLLVITATIGPAAPGAATPSLAELQQAVDGQVVDSRSDLTLPVVKLETDDHGVEGASPQHWRGAFAVNDHLIAVALYAREGSASLDDRGALLLNDMARRTQEASAVAAPSQPAPAASDSSGQLRPRARPGSDPATTEAAATPAKQSLRSRIAGLFK